MEDYTARYTLRVSRLLLEKFGYIAEYEGRTKNKELEQMLKKRIKEFEAEHGIIEASKISNYIKEKGDFYVKSEITSIF